MGKVQFLTKFLAKTVSKPQIAPLQNFNKAGNRILARQILSTKDPILKKFNIPHETATAEKLVVEKNFGKDAVEIISFKNSKGELLARNRMNYNGGELSDYSSSRYCISRNYSGNKDDFDYVLSVSDKQTQYFNNTGNLTSMDRIKTDILKINNQPDKHISRMRYKAVKNQNGNFDGQFSVYHKYQNKITNEISMNTTHSQDGKLMSSQLKI